MRYLALESYLAAPMVVLVLQGPVVTVVDTKIRLRNVQVGPDNLQCLLYGWLVC